MRGSLERARSELAERLRERRGEIVEALLTRTYAIADPKEAADPEYVQGLRAAVSAALAIGLAAVEHGEERAPSVPVLLLAQARLAARNNIPLDTVLRRYFAGYTTLGDFIVQEAGEMSLGEAGLKRILRDQAVFFDRLVVAVSDEHGREASSSCGGSAQRRADLVKRLLDGDLLDGTSLGYEFDVVHIGLVATGDGTLDAIRSFARTVDRRLLLIPHGEVVWAWLGGRRVPDPHDLERLISSFMPANVCLALGEPGQGLAGWRLTHLQASAALPIAVRGPKSLVRYADVALLASILRDSLLTDSLHYLYLKPLEGERDGGAVFRETLRCYLDARENASSAAATLGVSRRTITSRIRTIEERLGKPLSACAAEIEVALRFQAMDGDQPNGFLSTGA